MIRFRCPRCSTVLQVEAQHAGKTVACKCGTKIKVPAGRTPANASTSPSLVQAESKVKVYCPSCRQPIAIQAGSQGKSVRCPCGHVFRLGGFSAAHSQPVAPRPPTPAPTARKTSVVPDLQPIPNAISVSPASSVASPSLPDMDLWDDLDVSAPAHASAFRGPTARPVPVQAARAARPNQHLAAAQAELQSNADIDRRYQQASGVFFNGAVVSGIAMMGGAAIWFVAGLAVGIIFFYPPILFLFGLISFGKGCLGMDD